MKSLDEAIEKWKCLTHLQDTSDDHTPCPECGDQVFSCECPQVLAHKIVHEITRREISFNDKGLMRINVRIKDEFRK